MGDGLTAADDAAGRAEERFRSNSSAEAPRMLRKGAQNTIVLPSYRSMYRSTGIPGHCTGVQYHTNEACDDRG